MNSEAAKNAKYETFTVQCEIEGFLFDCTMTKLAEGLATIELPDMLKKAINPNAKGVSGTCRDEGDGRLCFDLGPDAIRPEIRRRLRSLRKKHAQELRRTLSAG